MIITGPSGSGKTVFIKALISKYPKDFEHSISHTTRQIRPNEKNGVDYHFIS